MSSASAASALADAEDAKAEAEIEAKMAAIREKLDAKAKWKQGAKSVTPAAPKTAKEAAAAWWS